VKIVRVIATGIQTGTGTAIVATLLCNAAADRLPPWWLSVILTSVLVGSSAVIIAARREGS
jgi:hypothetical protein